MFFFKLVYTQMYDFKYPNLMFLLFKKNSIWSINEILINSSTLNLKAMARNELNKNPRTEKD